MMDRVPELRAILSALLDRRERLGRLPSRVTMDVPEGVALELRQIMSPRAVKVVHARRVRLDLAEANRVLAAQGHPALDNLLYQVLQRAPRSLPEERAAIRAELLAGLRALQPQARAECSRRYLAAATEQVSRNVGACMRAASTEGAAAALDEERILVRTLDAVLENSTPIRLQNFSARLDLGSKGLSPGSDRYRRVCEALLLHDEETRAVVEDRCPADYRAAGRLALEAHHVLRDEAAVSVLCFGPIVYEKGGTRFDHVARHAQMGECTRLTLQQLRGAVVNELDASTVTVVENQTPFLDYVDVLKEGGIRDEIVLASDGQANWAVVALIRLLAIQGARVRHCGDLDRSGVLIMRSLANRAQCPIHPFWMDAEVHTRFVDRGLRVPEEEGRRLDALVAQDSKEDMGHDLLATVQRTRTWIEQEAFFGEVVEERRSVR